KPGGFSGWLPSNLRGARTTTWLVARILVRMDKLHDVRHVTARSHAPLDPDRADVRAAHHVAGRHVSAPTPIGPSRLRPLSAYGARLRRVRFVNLDGRRELVVQQVDELAVAG